MSEEKSQITGDVAATVEAAIALAVEATITAREAGVLPEPQSQSVAEQSLDSATTPIPAATEAIADTQSPTAQAEVPVLFSPTPDQSVAIAQYVNANTRHFTGNPDAKVVLVEFSDFW